MSPRYSTHKATAEGRAETLARKQQRQHKRADTGPIRIVLTQQVGN